MKLKVIIIIYSRFHDEDSLLKVVADRLREHIETTYATVPRKEQIEQGTLTRQSASNYEREAIPELSYEDLNVDLSTEMIAAAEDLDKARVSPLELPRLLLSRGYLWKDSSNNVLRPTIAGTLLLANRPGIVLPQARVQLDVYAGSVRSADPIDAVFIDAALPSAIEQAVAFIRRNTSRPLLVEGLKRKSVEAYPPEALREVIVNAVAHRDYSDPGAKVCVEVFADRLRVTSPGLPPGGQSIERLARGEAPSRARNPLLVQGLFWLEFMDERGSGIRRMTKVLEQTGHARPVFRAEHDSLVVEFLPVQSDEGGAFETLKQLTDNESDSREKILREINRSGTIRTKICVQRLGIPRATAQRILAQLVEEGKIESVGAGPKTSYRLTKEAK